MISAQVILKPIEGFAYGKDELITSENISKIRLDQRLSESLASYLKEQGFKIGPLIGISFSIEADQSVFEKYFDVSLLIDKEKGVKVGKYKRKNLPIRRIPNHFRKCLVTIVFPTPPAYFKGNTTDFFP